MSTTERPTGLIRRTLRRRWIPILNRWALLTVALMCAAYVGLRPPYRAASLLRGDPAGVGLFEAHGDESIGPFLQTQVELIVSPNVLAAAAANPKVAALPSIAGAGDKALAIRDRLKVAILPGTSLIQVSSESPSAVEAATLVNAVVDAFLDANVEWSDGMTRNQIRNLATYLSDLKNKSAELERAWKEIVAREESKGKLRPLAAVNESLRKRVEDRLIENDLKRAEAAAQLEAIRRKYGENAGVATIQDLEVRIDAATILDKALRARLASLVDDPIPGKMAADEVEVLLLKHRHEELAEMQKAVNRRLEQIRFEAKSEARIRAVNVAGAPGRPIRKDLRPWVMAILPFATFGAVLAFFAGIEARSGRLDPPTAG